MIGGHEAIDDYLNKVFQGDSPKLNETQSDAYYEKLNQVLCYGNVEDLLYLYKNYSPDGSYNNETLSVFWNKAILDKRMTKIHVPLAKQITNFMPALLFNNTPRYSVSTGNKEVDKRINKIVSNVLEKNEFSLMLKDGAKLESYSGALAAKFIIDSEYSNEPIIMLYPKESFKLRYKYGRVFEVVFIDIYEKDKKRYRLESSYGKGYIKYKLYDISGKIKEVPLTTIEETSMMQDIYITQNGKPYDKLLCAYKTNRPGILEGESDYASCYSLFEGIDALASYRELYFKYGSRVKTAVSESQLEMDSEGNVNIKDLEDNGLDVLVLRDNRGSDYKDIRDTLVPNLTQSAFDEAIDSLSKKAVQTVGLSPVSFGLEAAGRNASADAMEIREAANYRLREDKLELWNVFIQDMMELSLVFKTIMTIGLDTNTVDIPEFNYSYIVQFPEARQKSDLERAETIFKLEATKYIDHRQALEMFYEPMLESDELTEMIDQKMAEYEANKQSMEDQFNQDTSEEDSEDDNTENLEENSN